MYNFNCQKLEIQSTLNVMCTQKQLSKADRIQDTQTVAAFYTGKQMSVNHPELVCKDL